jgi:hypothetical protein
MLTFLVYLAIACFVGLAALSHVLLLQALFTSMDRASGKRERSRPRGVLPRLPV